VTKDRSYPPLPDALPISVTDNHAHLEPFQRFPDQPFDLDQQLSLARSAGVSQVVQCGCDLAAARWTAQYAVKNAAVLGAIAIHPNDAARLATGTPRLNADGRPSKEHDTTEPEAVQLGPAYADAFSQIAQLAASEQRIRAIGETGLDYFRTGPAGRPAQRQAFRDHIALAKELGLAMQIHDRDAHTDIVKTLLADGAPERTVFHSFSADRELAELAAANGWYCSFSGTVTFKPSLSLRAAAASLPPELVLVETDSPYLTPEPFRGRPNAPYMAALTMRTLADCLDLPLEAACHQVQQNSGRVYGQW
jgi:TatD DNase family protein